MKLHSIIFIHVFSGILSFAFGQDTFSIVAADSTTREVGSAGASCLDLFAAGFNDPTFIGDLLPDTGAINTQALYLAANQNNARTRMRLGESPSEIINWLVKHDAGDNFAVRQYGIAGFSDNSVSAAGFTGNQNTDYKNHRTGSIDGIHYSIQGNILKGAEIIDSMETRFRNANGDLACRLMASLQGANVIGADTRCTADGTSSLFAFVKVAQPADSYGNPSLKISVRTHDNSHIEPIDSLQSLFDIQHNCIAVGTEDVKLQGSFSVFPNPAKDIIYLTVESIKAGSEYQVYDSTGKQVMSGRILPHITTLDIKRLPTGLYLIRIYGCLPQSVWKI
jgi:uncharacterized Ntn-hydrolase superfamily protein